MEYFWENSEWEKEDKHLLKLEKMPFRRDFPFIPKKDGLYIIRGPRQIGKSSWLKTILKYYSERKKCFYLSLENIENYKELSELLDSVADRDVILLDEISFVDKWDRSIKHFVDSGKSKILVMTGSHSYDLKRGADLMPGRFGEGGEFSLLPMTFDEYYTARLQAGWTFENKIEDILAYFRTGGFPDAVLEGGQEGKFPKKAIETYWKWLVGDAVKLGKQETYLEEVVIQLAQVMTSPISLQSLAQKTAIGSHHTVKDYLSILESCFALKTLYAIDLDTSAYRYKKDKKFYFRDPLIFWIGKSLLGRKFSDEFYPQIAEMVAHEELSRKFRRFGYFNNKKGEIDFISPKEWAVEVKWADSVHNLLKAYYELNLLNKKVWYKGNFLL